MRRTLSLLLCLLLLLSSLSLLAACGEESLPTKTLNVYNWGQYISDGSDELPDVNAEFESYFNENLAEKYGYRIKVNYSTYASNEDMYNKLVSGSASYDIIIPSDYMIERLIAEDRLLALDFGSIPNYEYIDERFKTEYNTYDPDGKYSVPYTYNMVGIIYNTNPEYGIEASAHFGSWELLWDENYVGKILQFNNPRDAFGTALYSLGYSVNTTDKEKWREAQSKLLRQKPLVQAYVMDEIFNKMISGSSYIAPYYPGDFLTMYDSNDDLAFYYPEEGTNFFVDAMCIPKGAKNPEVAHDYIDFMLSEEIAVANAMYIGYASPNTLVVSNEDYIAYMNDWHEDAMNILYGHSVILDDYTDLKDVTVEDAAMLKASFYRTISNTEENGNLLDFTNTLWSEVKTESSIEPWIYVADTVIVAALLFLFLFSFIRRRRREKEY